MNKEKKKKIAASAVAVGLILALGLGGTFAKYVDDESEKDDSIEDKIEAAARLHDDFNYIQANQKPVGANINRDIYVENIGDVNLYVRVRLDEYMEYAGKSVIPGGVRGDKTTWKAHKPSGNDIAECGTGIHDYFTFSMGGTAEYLTDLKNRYDSKTGADALANASAADKQTTLGADVVTMTDYAAMTDAQKAAGPYWIIDNTGDASVGYAYWSEVLPKKVVNGATTTTTATGLLLDEITNTGMVDDNYYYGIRAKAEAVSESDLIHWINGSKPADAPAAANRASTEAVKLLKRISKNYIEITAAMSGAANPAEGFDKDSDGFLTKKEYEEFQAANPATN